MTLRTRLGGKKSTKYSFKNLNILQEVNGLNKMWYVHTVKLYSAIKRNQLLTNTCNNTDESKT